MNEPLGRVATELSSISQLASEAGQLETVLDRAARALHDVLPGDLVGILDLVEAEGGGDGEVDVRARVLEVQGAVSERSADESIGLDRAVVLQQLAESCRSQVLPGSRTLEEQLAPLVQRFEHERLRTCLLIPVQYGGSCRGFVAILSSTADAFGPEHSSLARLFANIVGVALENEARVEELHRRNQRLSERNRLLAAAERRGRSAENDEPVIWKSPAMVEVMKVVQQISITDASVLLTGETGVGKDELARIIHARSPRARNAYVAVNCAALPAELIESELFGHARGAFSGAVQDHMGRFEVADGGTLLLDEIGDMPLELQPKLLRVLQDRQIRRIGEDRPRTVDVRVITATNSDLQEAIEDGRFRQDLYYRLGVFHLHIPPLRERREDLPLLCEQILEAFHQREGAGPWTITDRMLERLAAHDWPGNIRELVNVLERSCILSPGPELEVQLAPTGTGGGAATSSSVPAGGPDGPCASGASGGPGVPAGDAGPGEEGWLSLEEYTRRYIEQVLRHTGGRIYGEKGAAELLDLPPTTLQSRIKRMGIDRNAFEE